MNNNENDSINYDKYKNSLNRKNKTQDYCENKLDAILLGNRDSNIDNIVNINNIDNIDSGNLDDTGNDSGHNTLIKDDNSNKFVYQKQRVIKPSSMVDYKIDIERLVIEILILILLILVMVIIIELLNQN